MNAKVTSPWLTSRRLTETPIPFATKKWLAKLVTVQWARAERRRLRTAGERAAIMAEADRTGVSVKAVARHHDICESLLFGWRAARRKAHAEAAKPVQFFAHGAIDARPPSLLGVNATQASMSVAPVVCPMISASSTRLSAISCKIRPKSAARRASNRSCLRSTPSLGPIACWRNARPARGWPKRCALQSN